VTVAVLGDGYFEVAKHVWLAAYLLEVTLVGLAGVVLSVGADALRSWHCGGRVMGNVGWGQAALARHRSKPYDRDSGGNGQ